VSRAEDGFVPEDPSCWISPAGKVTFVGGKAGDSHCEVARTLGDATAGRELEEKGWLHVSYSSIYRGYRDGRDLEPTQAQLDALWDISVRVAEVLGEEDYPVVRFRRFIHDNAPKEALA
jgi:hypothetical protein